MKASFWERLLAKIIDHLIFKALAGLVLVIAVLTAADVPSLINNLLLLLSLLILLLPLHLLYDIYLTAKLGGTLGKLIVGLEVLDENGKRLNLKTSLYRHTVGYFISGQLCGLGFLWTLRRDKAAWHDSLTNTAVIKKTNNSVKIFIALTSLITLIIIEATLTVTSLATNTKLTDEINSIRSAVSNDQTTNSNLSKSLVFKNQEITLNRMGSGQTEGTFWEKQLTQEDGAKWTQLNENEITKNLYEGGGGDWFFYIQPDDIYYELQPGGHRTLKIVDSDYIRNQIKNENSTYRQVGCQENDYSMGTIPTKAVSCTTTLTNPEDTNQKDVSTTTNCYLGLSNNSYGSVTRYLAYEQRLKPMGDASTCDVLTYMGVQGISERAL